MFSQILAIFFPIFLHGRFPQLNDFLFFLLLKYLKYGRQPMERGNHRLWQYAISLSINRRQTPKQKVSDVSDEEENGAVGFLSTVQTNKFSQIHLKYKCL